MLACACSLPTYLCVKFVLLKDHFTLSVASIRVSIRTPNVISRNRPTVIEIVCNINVHETKDNHMTLRN